MADQINPMDGLATAPSLTLASASRPQPVQERPRAKPADSQPSGPGNGPTEATAAALDSAAQSLSSYLQLRQADLMFQVDKSTGRTIFKIVDTKTQEVIRQVPSEEVLAMARKLRALADPKGAAGVLVDQEG